MQLALEDIETTIAEQDAQEDKKDTAETPVVPENPVRPDSHDEGESEHHPTRCLPSSI
jgi:hypothetical protein